MRPVTILAFEARSQAKFPPAAPQQTRRWPGQQLLTRAINESQALCPIESEDGDVNFGHDRAQQSGSFQSTQSLFAQRLPEFIDLEHHFAEGITAPGAPSANRKVSFANGRKNI
jgi:hypothetical protein